MNPPVDRVLEALRQAGYMPRRSGEEWVCRCPAHPDANPSFGLREGEDGRALVNCFAGCTAEQIVAALGLTMRDLMPDADRERRSAVSSPNTKPRFATLSEAIAALSRSRGTPTKVWHYRDADGRVVGAVLRWDYGGGKSVLQVSLHDGLWSSQGMPAPRPLYRLPELRTPGRIVVCEGEKATDAACDLGFNATTSVQGSGSARGTDWSPLAGREVVVLPDNDPGGAKYARDVLRITGSLNPPAKVKIVELPGLPPKGDIVEFVAGRSAEGLSSEAIRAEIEALINVAPEASVGSVSAAGGEVPETEWPSPEPLPTQLPPIPAFDPAMLPEAMRPWITDIADRIQCPADYPAVAAMIALATVVGRKVGIRPKRYDDWTVVPNLWGFVVGRPGVMKTPGMQEALRPLSRLELSAKREFDERQREAQAEELVDDVRRKEAQRSVKRALRNPEEARRLAMESLPTEQAKIVRRRYIVNDATVEKLGEVLAENPQGVLTFRDELVGFLKRLEKDGHETDRAFYLEAWNGTSSFTYDRIGRGTIDIPSATVSLLGGIQPGPLAQYQRAVSSEGSGDDGLLQRFQLAVWPDVSKTWVNVDRWPETDARKRAYQVFEGLDSLDPHLIEAEFDHFDERDIPFLRFDDASQVRFDHYRAELEHLVRSEILPPALESHLAKYRSLVPSLALLIHLADGHRGPVGIASLERALAWATFLRAHAERIYAHAQQPEMVAAIALSKKVLAGDLGTQFATRDVYRKGWSGLSSVEEARDAIKVLTEFGWLREVQQATEGRTGTAYLINPRIFGDAEFDETPSACTDRTDGSPSKPPSVGFGGASSGGEQEFPPPSDGDQSPQERRA